MYILSDCELFLKSYDVGTKMGVTIEYFFSLILSFADDACILCDNKVKVQDGIVYFENYCNLWNMS